MAEIVGIDPSISCTGLASGTSGEDVEVVSFSSQPCPNTVPHRMARFERLVGQMNDHLDGRSVGLILIEGYALGAKGQQHKLAEFGGLLRWNMLDHCQRVLEVPPSVLKRFATGKGNAKKDLVMAHVAQRWGRLFENSDQADAFVLFRLGLVLSGVMEAENEHQRESVRKVEEANR